MCRGEVAVATRAETRTTGLLAQVLRRHRNHRVLPPAGADYVGGLRTGEWVSHACRERALANHVVWLGVKEVSRSDQNPVPDSG
jgi:hypothetical protein